MKLKISIRFKTEWTYGSQSARNIYTFSQHIRIWSLAQETFESFDTSIIVYYKWFKFEMVTSMLVTDVGDRFKMLVTDLRCWWPIWYIEKNHQLNEKSRQHNDSVTNILNRSRS